MPLAQPTQPVDRKQVGLTARGLLAESFELMTCSGAAAPTSQKVFGQLVGLKAGDIVTNINLAINVGAAGTSPTLARFGLANSAGVMLAVSNDLGTAAGWTAGKITPFALSSPYTILADGGYFACFVVNGTWGSTQPTLMRQSPDNGASTKTGFAPLDFQWTGQTDLPAVGNSLTITSPTSPAPWIGVG